jgi:hypothetical protein
VVTPIEGDRSARLTEEHGDGVLGGADFPEADLVLTLGAVILRTSEDHEAVIQLGKAAPVLGWRLLVVVPTLALPRLT